MAMTDAHLTDLLERVAAVADGRPFPAPPQCDALTSLIETLYEDGYAWRRLSLLAEDTPLALEVAFCLIARARTERELGFVAADLVEELVALGSSDVLEKLLDVMRYAVICRCLLYCHTLRWSAETMEKIAERATAMLAAATPAP